MQTAWEMPPTELIKRLVGAYSAACGADAREPIKLRYATEARYLTGIVLARLEGKNPPFKSGNRVRWHAGDKVETVRRVHYIRGPGYVLESEGEFGLELAGMRDVYPASEFRLAPAETAAGSTSP